MTSSLKVDITNQLITYSSDIMKKSLAGEKIPISDVELETEKIFEKIEKRIDEIKQQEIIYITGNDNGTEKMADTINDIQTENYWRGIKNTINQIKKILK